jgi:uncharacterized iron-regulated membrane protein
LRGAVTWFRNGIRGKARYWNWHNVFGIWSCVPLFLVVLSATVISFPWASNLVFRLAGSEPPDAGRQRNRDAAILSTTDLSKADFAIAHAALQIPDWKTIALRLQASRDGAVSLAVDRGNAGQPQLRSTLTVGRSDEEKILVETFEEQSAGSRARSWLRFVHTGEYYGIAGQTIAGIASFAAIMLVWTGFALSWNRLNVWHSRRKQGSVAVDPMDSGR